MAPADVAELLVASGARDPRLVAIGAAIALRHVVGDPARLPADQRGVAAALEHWARGTGDRDALIVVGERLAAPVPLPLRIVRELARVDGAARAAELDALCAVAALMLWSQTPSGRAWHAAHPRPTPAQVHADPVAAQGIAAQRRKLAATIREIIGDGDHAAAAARFAVWLARDRATPAEQKPARDHTPLGAQIAAHVAKRVGAVLRTYRDRDRDPGANPSATGATAPGAVQIDVHVVAPRRGDRVVLVTSGMAERPLALTADDGTRATVYTELAMSLPAGWLYGDDDLRDPRWFWPFAWLRFLGRRPHDNGTALRAGEVVGPLQPPGTPRATRFDAVLLAESALVPDLAMAGRTITFLDVCPLYAAEFALARSHGRAELLGRFVGEGCDPAIVDPARASVA